MSRPSKLAFGIFLFLFTILFLTTIPIVSAQDEELPPVDPPQDPITYNIECFDSILQINDDVSTLTAQTCPTQPTLSSELVNFNRVTAQLETYTPEMACPTYTYTHKTIFFYCISSDGLVSNTSLCTTPPTSSFSFTHTCQTECSIDGSNNWTNCDNAVVWELPKCDTTLTPYATTFIRLTDSTIADPLTTTSTDQRQATCTKTTCSVTTCGQASTCSVSLSTPTKAQTLTNSGDCAVFNTDCPCIKSCATVVDQTITMTTCPPTPVLDSAIFNPANSDWTFVETFSDCQSTRFNHKTIKEYCFFSDDNNTPTQSGGNCGLVQLGSSYSVMLTSDSGSCQDYCSNNGTNNWFLCTDDTNNTWNIDSCASTTSPQATRWQGKFHPIDTNHHQQLITPTQITTTATCDNPTCPQECQPSTGCNAVVTSNGKTWTTTFNTAAQCTQVICPCTQVVCLSGVYLINANNPTIVPCPTKPTTLTALYETTDWNIQPGSTCASSNFVHNQVYKYCLSNNKVTTHTTCSDSELTATNTPIIINYTDTLCEDRCKHSLTDTAWTTTACSTSPNADCTINPSNYSLTRYRIKFHTADVTSKNLLLPDPSQPSPSEQGSYTCTSTDCDATTCLPNTCNANITYGTSTFSISLPQAKCSNSYLTPACPCARQVKCFQETHTNNEDITSSTAVACPTPPENRPTAFNSPDWVWESETQGNCFAPQFRHTTIFRYCTVNNIVKPSSECTVTEATGVVVANGQFRVILSGGPSCVSKCNHSSTGWGQCDNWSGATCTAGGSTTLTRETASFYPADSNSLYPISKITQSGTVTCSTLCQTNCQLPTQCLARYTFGSGSDTSSFDVSIDATTDASLCSSTSCPCPSEVKCSSDVYDLSQSAPIFGTAVACPTEVRIPDVQQTSSLWTFNPETTTSVGSLCSAAQYTHQTIKRYCVRDNKIVDLSSCSITPVDPLVPRANPIKLTISTDSNSRCVEYCAVTNTDTWFPCNEWQGEANCAVAAQGSLQRQRAKFHRQDDGVTPGIPFFANKIALQTDTNGQYTCTPTCSQNCGAVTSCGIVVRFGTDTPIDIARNSAGQCSAVSCPCVAESVCYEGVYAINTTPDPTKLRTCIDTTTPRTLTDIYAGGAPNWTFSSVTETDKCTSSIFFHKFIFQYCVHQGKFVSHSQCGRPTITEPNAKIYITATDTTPCVPRCAPIMTGQGIVWGNCNAWPVADCTIAPAQMSRSIALFHSQDTNFRDPISTPITSVSTQNTCTTVQSSCTNCNAPTSCTNTITFPVSTFIPNVVSIPTSLTDKCTSSTPGCTCKRILCFNDGTLIENASLTGKTPIECPAATIAPSIPITNPSDWVFNSAEPSTDPVNNNCPISTFTSTKIFSYCSVNGVVRPHTECGATSTTPIAKPIQVKTIPLNTCTSSCAPGLTGNSWGDCQSSTSFPSGSCTAGFSTTVSRRQAYFYQSDTTKTRPLLPVQENAIASCAVSSSCSTNCATVTSCTSTVTFNSQVINTKLFSTTAECTATACPCANAQIKCFASNSLPNGLPPTITEVSCPDQRPLTDIYNDFTSWTYNSSVQPLSCRGSTFTHKTIRKYCTLNGSIAAPSECGVQNVISGTNYGSYIATGTGAGANGDGCAYLCKATGSNAWVSCTEATSWPAVSCVQGAPKPKRSKAGFHPGDNGFVNPIVPAVEEEGAFVCTKTQCSSTNACEASECNGHVFYQNAFPSTPFTSTSLCSAANSQCPCMKCFNGRSLPLATPSSSSISCTAPEPSLLYGSEAAQWSYVQPTTTPADCATSQYTHTSVYKYCTLNNEVVPLSNCGQTATSSDYPNSQVWKQTVTFPNTSCVAKCSINGGTSWVDCTLSTSWPTPNCSTLVPPTRRRAFFHSVDINARDIIRDMGTQTANAPICSKATCSSTTCGISNTCNVQFTYVSSTGATVNVNWPSAQSCNIPNVDCDCTTRCSEADFGPEVIGTAPPTGLITCPVTPATAVLAMDGPWTYTTPHQDTCPTLFSFSHLTVKQYCFVDGKLNLPSRCTQLTNVVPTKNYQPYSITINDNTSPCVEQCSPNGTNWSSCSNPDSWKTPSCASTTEPLPSRSRALFIVGSTGKRSQISAQTSQTAISVTCEKSSCATGECSKAATCSATIIYGEFNLQVPNLTTCGSVNSSCNCSAPCYSGVPSATIGQPIATVGIGSGICETQPTTFVQLYSTASQFWAHEGLIDNADCTRSKFRHVSTFKYCIRDGIIVPHTLCNLPTPTGTNVYSPYVFTLEDPTGTCVNKCIRDTGNASGRVWQDCTSLSTFGVSACTGDSIIPTRLTARFRVSDTNNRDPIGSQQISHTSPVAVTCARTSCDPNACQAPTSCAASFKIGSTDVSTSWTLTPEQASSPTSICSPVKSECQCNTRCSLTAGLTASSTNIEWVPCPSTPTPSSIYTEWNQWTVLSTVPTQPTDCAGTGIYQHKTIHEYCIVNNNIVSQSQCTFVGTSSSTLARRQINFTDATCVDRCSVPGSSVWTSCDNINSSWSIDGKCSSTTTPTARRRIGKFRPNDTTFVNLIYEAPQQQATATCSISQCSSTTCSQPSSCTATVAFGGSTWETSYNGTGECAVLSSICNCSPTCHLISSPISSGLTVTPVTCPVAPTSTELYATEASAAAWSPISTSVNCQSTTFVHTSLDRICTINGKVVSALLCFSNASTGVFRMPLSRDVTFAENSCSLQRCSRSGADGTWYLCNDTTHTTWVPAGEICTTTPTATASRFIALFRSDDTYAKHKIRPAVTSSYDTSKAVITTATTCTHSKCVSCAATECKSTFTIESQTFSFAYNTQAACANVQAPCGCTAPLCYPSQANDAPDFSSGDGSCPTAPTMAELDAPGTSWRLHGSPNNADCTSTTVRHRSLRRYCITRGANTYTVNPLKVCFPDMTTNETFLPLTYTVGGFTSDSCSQAKCKTSESSSTWSSCTDSTLDLFTPATCAVSNSPTATRVIAYFRPTDSSNLFPAKQAVQTVPGYCAKSTCSPDTCLQATKCQLSLTVGPTTWIRNLDLNDCVSVNSECKCTNFQCTSLTTGQNIPCVFEQNGDTQFWQPNPANAATNTCGTAIIPKFTTITGCNVTNLDSCRASAAATIPSSPLPITLNCNMQQCQSCGVPQLINSATFSHPTGSTSTVPPVTLTIPSISLGHIRVGASNGCQCETPRCLPGRYSSTQTLTRELPWVSCDTISFNFVPNINQWTMQNDPICAGGKISNDVTFGRLSRCFSSDLRAFTTCPQTIQPAPTHSINSAADVICTPPTVIACQDAISGQTPCGSPAKTCNFGSISFNTAVPATAGYYGFNSQICPLCQCQSRCLALGGDVTKASDFISCISTAATTPGHNQWTVTNDSSMGCNPTSHETSTQMKITRTNRCIVTTTNTVIPRSYCPTQDPETHSFNGRCDHQNCVSCDEPSVCLATGIVGTAQTASFTFALPNEQCKSQCRCDIMCMKKNPTLGDVEHVCAPESDVCSSLTYGDLFDFPRCVLQNTDDTLDCAPNAETTLASERIHSCNQFCVSPADYATFNYDFNQHGSVNVQPNHLLQKCDNTFRRPGTFGCVQWLPTDQDRRIVCATDDETNPKVIPCPLAQQTHQMQTPLGQCVTICARKDNSAALQLTGEKTSFLATDIPGYQDCTSDSFRQHQCITETNVRHVYCATKIIGTGGAVTYEVTQEGSCSAENFYDILHRNCNIGCVVNTALAQVNSNTRTFADLRINEISPSQPPELVANCHVNTHRRYLATSCPVNDINASDTRTPVCMHPGTTPGTWVKIADNECKITGFNPTTSFDTLANAVWKQSDCEAWCFSRQGQIPTQAGTLSTAAGVISQKCTSASYKPESGINDCTNVNASVYRTAYLTYATATTGARRIAADSAMTTPAVSADFNNEIWPSQCTHEYRCTSVANPTTFNDYLAVCQSQDLLLSLCSDRCIAAFPVPTTNYACIRTKDWFGRNVSQLITSTTECTTHTKPIYDCGCSSEQLCAKTGASSTTSRKCNASSPTDQDFDPSWTLTPVCGELDHRQTFLKNKVDRYIPEDYCRANPTNCDSNLVWAPRNRVPINFDTLCSPNIVCSLNQSTPLADTVPCTSNGGYPVCNEDNCDGSTHTRFAQAIFVQKTLTAAQLIARIHLVNDPNNTLKTQYLSLVSAYTSQATSVSTAHTCDCAIQPWCRTIAAATKPAEELTRSDITQCTVGEDSLAHGCATSCTTFIRNDLVCRDRLGALTAISEDPTQASCGSYTAATLPTCAASHTCLARDFCSIYGTTPTTTSPACGDNVAFNAGAGICFTYDPLSPQPYSRSSCTMDPEVSYYRLREVRCLHYYNDQTTGSPTPLPANIRNIPPNLCPDPHAPISQVGCKAYTSCGAGLIGPLVVSAYQDATEFTQQFHEHGDVLIAWPGGHRGPTTSPNPVQASYALAYDFDSPEDEGLTWVSFPDTTNARLDAGSITVTLPSIHLEQPDGRIFLRINLVDDTDYLYYPTAIVVNKFVLCSDLDCEDRPGGNIECFIPYTEDELSKSAVCRCDAGVRVLWTSAECIQTQQCLEKSIACKNDGYYVFQRDTDDMCSTSCICPGSQEGDLCEGKCPEEACNFDQGFVKETSTSCNCSQCYVGYSGSNCNRCSRLTAITLPKPLPIATVLASNTRRRSAFITAFSTFFAEQMNLPPSSITIEPDRSQITNSTITMVVVLSGTCSSRQSSTAFELSQFDPLQGDNTINQIISAWDALSLEQLALSPQLRSIVDINDDDEFETTVVKEDVVDPVKCLRADTCPEFTRLSCQTEPDHPQCNRKSKINSGLALGIVIPLAIIIIIVALGVLLWHCGCCRSAEKEAALKRENAIKPPTTRRQERKKSRMQREPGIQSPEGDKSPNSTTNTLNSSNLPSSPAVPNSPTNNNIIASSTLPNSPTNLVVSPTSPIPLPTAALIPITASSSPTPPDHQGSAVTELHLDA